MTPFRVTTYKVHSCVGTDGKRLPLFRIDHVFASPTLRVRRCEVLKGALSRVASDPLPLLAELY